MSLEYDALIADGGHDGDMALLHEVDDLVITGDHPTMGMLPPIVSGILSISVAEKLSGESNLVDELDLELFGEFVALGFPVLVFGLVAQLPQHVVDSLPGFVLGLSSTFRPLQVDTLELLEGDGCVICPAAGTATSVWY